MIFHHTFKLYNKFPCSYECTGVPVAMHMIAIGKVYREYVMCSSWLAL